MRIALIISKSVFASFASCHILNFTLTAVFKYYVNNYEYRKFIKYKKYENDPVEIVVRYYKTRFIDLI